MPKHELDSAWLRLRVVEERAIKIAGKRASATVPACFAAVKLSKALRQSEPPVSQSSCGGGGGSSSHRVPFSCFLSRMSSIALYAEYIIRARSEGSGVAAILERTFSSQHIIFPPLHHPFLLANARHLHHPTTPTLVTSRRHRHHFLSPC